MVARALPGHQQAGHRSGVEDQEHVGVPLLLGHLRGADGAAAAGDVLDDHRLRGKLLTGDDLGDGSGQDIAASARGGGRDHL